MAEGWVAAPVRLLPFVPCRLQPSDVILQARQRVSQAADGTLRVEDYEKPRVTTVKTGTPFVERATGGS
eukprot:3441310-Pleurochrysis_carterae.AAC.1